MLGHFPKQQTDADPATLLPWLKSVILRREDSLTTEIQVRLRGNILHVLCESLKVGLPRTAVLTRLVRSLMEPEVSERFEQEFPQIYQIYVYSRQALEAKPVWSAPIYLNRLDLHLERLVQSGAGLEAAETLAKKQVAAVSLTVDTAADQTTAEQTTAGQAHAEGQPKTDNHSNQGSGEPSELHQASASAVMSAEISADQLSDVDLARTGDSGAIARYLSETLSTLNVGVKVSARVVPGKARRAKSVVSTSESRPSSTAGSSAPETETGIETQAIGENLETAPETGHLETGHLEAGHETAAEKASELVSRLWVFCEASYSPDPLLIAEPIAERLRQLHLRQFQDAVITIQVTGETASDWRLRVDLTPPEDMLKEWGRWGDLAALSQLVNQISKRYGLKLVAEIKKATLHLISYPQLALESSAEVDTRDETIHHARSNRATAHQGLEDQGPDSTALTDTALLDVEGLVADVGDLLVAIAPQGLERAMLYGPSTDDISPEWLRGIDLPAADQPERAQNTVELAAQGDLPALAYCLTRALNPDIKEQLATGGIRVQLLLKDKLLHIMADGPVCPPKHSIVPLITKTLKQVDVHGLEGLRLYGRRAGQKQPMWTHGTDYTTRQRLVPEAKPEFAASQAYIGELITPVSDASLAIATDPDSETDFKLGATLVRAFQYVCIQSQLFVPAAEKESLSLSTARPAPTTANFPLENGKMALIFSVVGVLLAVQFDFMVGRALRQAAAPVSQSVAANTPTGASEQTAETDVGRIKTQNPFRDELNELEWNTNNENDPGQEEFAWGDPPENEGFLGGSNSRFNNRDFTASAIDDDELIYSPQQDFVSTAALLAGSTLPTFRSQQLDEKIALYQRRVAQSGPPDVLVIGSSRALRGVDPAALRQALGRSGRDGLSVFNFGVNGATAQVVDLIVRRLIPADQLPQMIVWADGARAFNSGRTDVTFNAIAVSEGYKQLEAGESTDGINDLALGSLADQISVQTKATDRQMSEMLGRVSSAFTHREQIRTALGQGFGAIAPEFTAEAGTTQSGDTPTELPTETSLIDFDGFLALSTRFNPATYYQDHARVAGAYDGDYKDFQMEGKQTDALNNLLYFTTQKDVPVIFINTPLTDEYLDSRRTKAEEEFRQYMVQVANRSAFMTFRDLGQLWPQRYDYFSDPSHLNRYGAYQVSNRLAQDPLIAWPEAGVTTE